MFINVTKKINVYMCHIGSQTDWIEIYIYIRFVNQKAYRFRSDLTTNKTKKTPPQTPPWWDSNLGSLSDLSGCLPTKLIQLLSFLHLICIKVRSMYVKFDTYVFQICFYYFLWGLLSPIRMYPLSLSMEFVVLLKNYIKIRLWLNKEGFILYVQGKVKTGYIV